MLWIFAFTIFANRIVIASADCSQTDWQLSMIRDCYRPFFAGNNISLGDSGWPSYWPFHDYRSALLQNQGIDVQPYVCQLGNALVACTLTANSLCMDNKTFIKLGATANDSLDYWIDLLVTQYQCGDGYNILMQDFYCIGQCRSTNCGLLDQCQDTMMASIAAGKDKCQAFNSFFTCQSVIYAGCCGHNAGVYMCRVNQIVIGASDESCNGQLYTCPKPTVLDELLASVRGRRNH